MALLQLPTRPLLRSDDAERPRWLTTRKSKPVAPHHSARVVLAASPPNTHRSSLKAAEVCDEPVWEWGIVRTKVETWSRHLTRYRQNTCPLFAEDVLHHGRFYLDPSSDWSCGMGFSGTRKYIRLLALWRLGLVEFSLPYTLSLMSEDQLAWTIELDEVMACCLMRAWFRDPSIGCLQFLALARNIRMLSFCCIRDHFDCETLLPKKKSQQLLLSWCKALIRRCRWTINFIPSLSTKTEKD